MALDKSGLIDNLETLFETGFDNTTDAAYQWASIYNTFANTGEVSAVSPTIPLSAQVTLASTLKTSFDNNDTAIDTATDIATALEVFWTAPPIVFDTGTVSLVGGKLTLIIGLVTEFSFLNKTALQKATVIAELLNTFTETVEVTFTHPPPTPIDGNVE